MHSLLLLYIIIIITLIYNSYSLAIVALFLNRGLWYFGP